MTVDPIVSKTDIFVSVVSVIDASTAEPAAFITSAQAALAAKYTNYEMVLVDNGLSGAGLEAVKRLLHTIPCVRLLRLSRPFAYDTAVFSALDTAIGDYVVVLEAEVDPIDGIVQLVDVLLDGADIVQGISAQAPRGGRLQHTGRRAFYRYNSRVLGVRIPEDATYFTAFTRRALTTMLSSSRQYRYLRHLMRHIGFSVANYEYRQVRTSERSRSLRASAVDAVEMVTSYSVHPLRLMSIVGVVVAALNLLYAVYVVVVYLALPDVERGWTTTSLQISIMFLFLSIAVATISEYIGRLLAEARREPAYFVMEELVSDQTMADESRPNVV